MRKTRVKRLKRALAFLAAVKGMTPTKAGLRRLKKAHMAKHHGGTFTSGAEELRRSPSFVRPTRSATR